MELVTEGVSVGVSVRVGVTVDVAVLVGVTVDVGVIDGVTVGVLDGSGSLPLNLNTSNPPTP